MPDHDATGSRAAIYRITLTIPADDTTRDDHRPIRSRPPHEIVAALCGFGDPGELEYVEEPQATPDRAAKHRVVVFTHYAPNIWEWKCDCGQVGSSNVSAASAAALVDAHREARGG